MTTSPQWQDSGQGDLLELVAQGNPSLPTADEEWALYVSCLHSCAVLNKAAPGVIDPNWLRIVIAGRIKPQRVGAFAHRALSQGLVEYTGRYVVSTDTHGRNSGKPSREMRWLGHDPSP